MADPRRIPKSNWNNVATRNPPEHGLDFVLYAAARQRRPDGLVSYLLWLAPNSDEEPATPGRAIVYAGISSYVDRVLVGFHIADDGVVRNFEPPVYVRAGRRKGLLMLT